MTTVDQVIGTVFIKFNEVSIETTVTKEPSIVNKWIEDLENSDNLKVKKLNIGMDTEWTPLDKSQGEPENPVAIIQMCVDQKCLIYQIGLAKRIPWSLVSFLNNPEYTFTGVGIDYDFKKLALKKALLEVDTTSFGSKSVDLRDLAVKKGYFVNIEGVGMTQLAKNVLGLAVKKDDNARMSIWHKELNMDQVKYASIDAYLSFQIGRVLLENN